MLLQMTDNEVKSGESVNMMLDIRVPYDQIKDYQLLKNKLNTRSIMNYED
jgi:hypothetical protein